MMGVGAVKRPEVKGEPHTTPMTTTLVLCLLVLVVALASGIVVSVIGMC